MLVTRTIVTHTIQTLHPVHNKYTLIHRCIDPLQTEDTSHLPPTLKLKQDTRYNILYISLQVNCVSLNGICILPSLLITPITLFLPLHDALIYVQLTYTT
jgi:hypothetical protein